MTLEDLRAAHPDLVAALKEEGAADERARILAVEAQLLPGHEKLIAQLRADGKTTGPEAAVQVLNAERAVCAGRAQDIARAAPPPVPHAAAPEEAPPAASLTIEERTKADWDKDPALRAEFGSYDTYLAFAKAQASGAVRVLTKK